MFISPATTPPASPASASPHDRNTRKCHTPERDAPSQRRDLLALHLPYQRIIVPVRALGDELVRLFFIEDVQSAYLEGYEVARCRHSREFGGVSPGRGTFPDRAARNVVLVRYLPFQVGEHFIEKLVEALHSVDTVVLDSASDNLVVGTVRLNECCIDSVVLLGVLGLHVLGDRTALQGNPLLIRQG